RFPNRPWPRGGGDRAVDKPLPETLSATPSPLDEIRARLQLAWQAASPSRTLPRIEDQLGGLSETDRRALLPELVDLEIAYRRQRGEQPRAEEYRGRFPELSPDWLERELPPLPQTNTTGPSVAGAPTGPYVPAQDAEPVDTVPEHPPAAACVPGYEIEGVLGRGGMGVVYKARHLALKRTVALKMVLAGRHAAPQELARFRLEAEAVARLQHPNIVQIHEVGEADGHPYCALEFVEGGSLASNLKGKLLPAREAAKLAEALARAVQLAHSRNVVHRDLKPAN